MDSQFPELTAKLENLPREVTLAIPQHGEQARLHPHLMRRIVGGAALGALCYLGFEYYNSKLETIRWHYLTLSALAGGLIAWGVTPNITARVQTGEERVILPLSPETRTFIRNCYKERAFFPDHLHHDAILIHDPIELEPILYPTKLSCDRHWVSPDSLASLATMARSKCPECQRRISNQGTNDDAKALKQLNRLCLLMAVWERLKQTLLTSTESFTKRPLSVWLQAPSGTPVRTVEDLEGSEEESIYRSLAEVTYAAA